MSTMKKTSLKSENLPSGITDLFSSAADLSGVIRTVFDVAMDNILILSGDGRILEANQRAIACYGYSRDELLRMRLLDIRHPSTWNDYESQMAASELSGVFFESLHCRKDGSCFPVEVSSRSVRIDSHLLRIHIIRDITERRKTEARIHHLAHYDALTGLENRASIASRLEEIYNEAAAQKRSFAVAVIDLDRFKQVNDTYGHLAGDEVLRLSAQRFGRALRREDRIGRYGGDEFLLLQQNITGKPDVEALMLRIIHEFDQPWVFEGHRLSVGFSAGISIFPNDAAEREDLIRNADRAMYAAKNIAGNSFIFHGKV